MAESELSWEFDVEVLRLRRGRGELVLSARELAALVELATEHPAFERALNERAQGWCVVAVHEGEQVWLSHGSLKWLPHQVRCRVWPLGQQGMMDAEIAARLAVSQGYANATVARYYGK